VAKTVMIGGRMFEVRPLTLKMAREGLPKLAAAQEAGTEVFFAEVRDYIHGALARATPDLTVAWLEENLELPDVNGILATIREVSGLTAPAPGEAVSP
jgi:hypothetical protein